MYKGKFKIIKPDCLNCELNMGVCAGKHYGKSVEETKILYPNGCEEYKISFLFVMEVQEIKSSLMEMPWMEQMKYINAYDDFCFYEVTGKQIVDYFANFNERVGPKYKYIRKEKIDIVNKVPTLILNKKYRLLINNELWKSSFCGIFELDSDENICFFSYSLLDNSIAIEKLNEILLK